MPRAHVLTALNRPGNGAQVTPPAHMSLPGAGGPRQPPAPFWPGPFGYLASGSRSGSTAAITGTPWSDGGACFREVAGVGYYDGSVPRRSQISFGGAGASRIPKAVRPTRGRVRGSGGGPVVLAVFKTVARHPAVSRVGSTPMRSRHVFSGRCSCAVTMRQRGSPVLLFRHGIPIHLPSGTPATGSPWAAVVRVTPMATGCRGSARASSLHASSAGRWEVVGGGAATLILDDSDGCRPSCGGYRHECPHLQKLRHVHRRPHEESRLRPAARYRPRGRR